MEVIKTLSALVACCTLVACGGGGGSDPGPTALPAPAPAPAPPPAAAPSEPVAVTSVPAGVYADSVKLSAFNRVNELRSLAGLGLVRQDSAADQAAQAHSDYQATNYVLSHGETQGLPGFTGVSPAERLIAAGYSTANPFPYETITSRPLLTGAGHIDELISAPYHRLGVLPYSVMDIGIGRAVSSRDSNFVPVTVVVAHRPNTAQGAPNTPFAVWPYEGASGIARTMTPEVPDPIPENQGAPAGYAISVQVNEELRTLDVTSFTLADGNGSSVPVKLLSQATDSFLSSGSIGYYVAILPRSPLAANTTYTATLVGSYKYKNGTTSTPINKTWSFTTGAN